MYWIRRNLDASAHDSIVSPVPAAEYVRMSDEAQQYSIANQKDAIREYAAKNGFEIVKTYADAGKSGLTTKHRPGLRQLLSDVIAGSPNYKAILIYDVSRWGRFLNNDEAAHYEFLCSSSGIPLHYCAEPFSNDGTTTSSLLKSLKRSMAAEFSRELGVKVFRGKTRLVRLGFWVGGRPGFGYRRMMISAEGKPKQLLKSGEHKNLTTDRIVLVPGPQEEVECVRHMFSMAIEGYGCSAIARDLNRRDVFRNGKLWSPVTVLQIITNEKYAGWNIWYRTDQRLSICRKAVQPQDWVKQPNAFPALVDQETFDSAQKALPRWADITWKDAEIIRKLKSLCAAKGRISNRLMLSKKGMPGWNTLTRRFGKARNAYRKAGYDPGDFDIVTCERFERNKRWRRMLIAKLQQRFRDRVAVTHLPNSTRSVLRIDNTFMVSILVCRGWTRNRRTFWQVQPIEAEREFVTLLCRLFPGYTRMAPLYVFPKLNKFRSHNTYQNDPWLRTGVKLHSISEFYEAVLRLWNSQTPECH